MQGSPEGECSSPRLTFRTRLVNSILGLKSPSVQSVSVPGDYLNDYALPPSRRNMARAPRPLSWGCVCTVAHPELPYSLLSYLLGPLITLRVTLRLYGPGFKLQNGFQLLSDSMNCDNIRGLAAIVYLENKLTAN